MNPLPASLKSPERKQSRRLKPLVRNIYSHLREPIWTRTSLASSSRRGYNAKKRSEAAQIAAQNGSISRDSDSTQLMAPPPPQHWCPCSRLRTCQFKIRAKIRRPTEVVSLIFLSLVLQSPCLVKSLMNWPLSRVSRSCVTVSP